MASCSPGDRSEPIGRHEADVLRHASSHRSARERLGALSRRRSRVGKVIPVPVQGAAGVREVQPQGQISMVRKKSPSRVRRIGNVQEPPGYPGTDLRPTRSLACHFGTAGANFGAALPRWHKRPAAKEVQVLETIHSFGNVVDERDVVRAKHRA